MFGMLMFFMRRMNRGNGGIMGVGKSRAKAYVQKETGITFKNVAGQDEAKDALPSSMLLWILVLRPLRMIFRGLF